MSQLLFDTSIVNQLNLHILPTNKFKTTTMMIHIEQDLKEETVTQTALIPHILKRGCEKYPSTQQLRQYTDQLFGAVYHADVVKKGEKQIIQIQLEIANEKYLSDTSPLLRRGIEFLGEVVARPLVEDGGFKNFVRSESDLMKKRISSLVDDKIRYANQRVTEEMCKDEPYRLLSYGRLEDLNDVDPVKLYQYYQQLLAENPIDFYVIGDVQIDEVREAVEQFFKLNRQNVRHIEFNPVQKKHVEEKIVIDHMDVGQGKLNIGCRTHITLQDEDYETLLVYNGILGGFPHSKLFVNVREKASLAYYAVSRLESHKGIMILMSGIETDKFDQALEIMKKQMAMMKSGEISETELKQTKAALGNQLLETKDNARTIIDLSYNGRISSTEKTLEQILEKVNKVTIEDVVAVAQKVEIDTVYFLRDKEGKS